MFYRNKKYTFKNIEKLFVNALKYFFVIICLNISKTESGVIMPSKLMKESSISQETSSQVTQFTITESGYKIFESFFLSNNI